MGTQNVLIMPDDITTSLGVADAVIDELREKYGELKASDNAGYHAVRLAIADVRKVRVDVEKARKDLKADALEYGRKVDAEAKRVTALLLEIEEPLKAEKARIDDAKETARREKEEAERKQIEAEMEAKRKEQEELRRQVEEKRLAEQKRIAQEQEAERKQFEAFENATGIDIAGKIIEVIEKQAKPGKTKTKGKG